MITEETCIGPGCLLIQGILNYILKSHLKLFIYLKTAGSVLEDLIEENDEFPQVSKKTQLNLSKMTSWGQGKVAFVESWP